jgi:diguanylate cyclase (GGDEF)-like protein
MLREISSSPQQVATTTPTLSSFMPSRTPMGASHASHSGWLGFLSHQASLQQIGFQLSSQAVIAELGQQALNGSSLNELLMMASERVRELMDAPVCRIWQMLSDGDTYRPIAIAGIEPPVNHLYAIEHPWLQILLNHKTLIYVSGDLTTGPNSAPNINATSSVALIVESATDILGFVELAGLSKSALNNDETEFLQAISQFIATVIERDRQDNLQTIQRQILEQVTADVPLADVFTSLCLLLEQQSVGSVCTITQIDESGQQLLPVAAPSISSQWVIALDGQEIGEHSGSFGAALSRQAPVFVNDVATDPIWQKFHDLAKIHQIRSMWSTPFFGNSGEVLGTFDLAHRRSCVPTPFHQRLIDTAIHLATIAAENHRNANKLQQQALYDCLTGLPNRMFFMQQLIDRLPQKDQPFALLFLDVDHFKLVNDSMGHNAGDQLLIEITRRLRPCIRRTDIFARLGGDEFAIILEGVSSGRQAQSIADQIKAVLSLPFHILEREVFASVSIGIAHSDQYYASPEDILRDADIAMYRAKSLGRSQSATFDKAMHENVLDRMQIEMELRRIVDQLFLDGTSDLQLHYQPIIALNTGKISGFEALLRWPHEERGMISPLEFIPIAEETGLIVPIGQWVIQEACQQLHHWQTQLDMMELTMSVNVSSRQFLQAEFLPMIRQALEYTEISPACLKLEITESVLMETAKSVTERLEYLRDLGVRLSLDDFGTGYSSLSYLQQFPINTLKVDRSFITNLAHEQDQVVQAIVALTDGLSMDAVAEGIETEAQLHHLQELGCEYGQGYLFSPALDRAKAEQMLIDDPRWETRSQKNILRDEKILQDAQDLKDTEAAKGTGEENSDQ